MKLKKQLKKARKHPTKAAKRLTKNAIAHPARTAKDATKIATQSVKHPGVVTRQMAKAFGSMKKTGRFIGAAAAGVAAAVMAKKGQKALKDAGIRNLDDAKDAMKGLGAKRKANSKRVQRASRAIQQPT